MNTKDAATDTPASAVAEPVVVVPKNPTEAMIVAGKNHDDLADRHNAMRLYKAMVAAAPPPIARSAADDGVRDLREIDRVIEQLKDAILLGRPSLMVPKLRHYMTELATRSPPVGSQQSGSGEATVSDAMTFQQWHSKMTASGQWLWMSDYKHLEMAWEAALAAQSSPPASGVGEELLIARNNANILPCLCGGGVPADDDEVVEYNVPVCTRCQIIARIDRALATSSDTQARDNMPNTKVDPTNDRAT